MRRISKSLPCLSCVVSVLGPPSPCLLCGLTRVTCKLLMSPTYADHNRDVLLTNRRQSFLTARESKWWKDNRRAMHVRHTRQTIIYIHTHPRPPIHHTSTLPFTLFSPLSLSIKSLLPTRSPRLSTRPVGQICLTLRRRGRARRRTRRSRRSVPGLARRLLRRVSVLVLLRRRGLGIRVRRLCVVWLLGVLLGRRGGDVVVGVLGWGGGMGL